MKRTLSDAILLATMAHKDQIDKAGLPYILHPLHVMQAVIQTQGPGEVAMAAVLHDVVEDCSDWPLDRL
jgi:(p)ppGpp synthase/HD superfamily hydrolase